MVPCVGDITMALVTFVFLIPCEYEYQLKARRLQRVGEVGAWNGNVRMVKRRMRESPLRQFPSVADLILGAAGG